MGVSGDNERKGLSGSALAKGPLDTRSCPSASVYFLLGDSFLINDSKCNRPSTQRTPTFQKY